MRYSPTQERALIAVFFLLNRLVNGYTAWYVSRDEKRGYFITVMKRPTKVMSARPMFDDDDPPIGHYRS